MSDPRLRLILVTDGVGDPQRIEEVARAAIRAGCRCVQLREPRWSARAMLRACEALRPIVDAVDGLLLVNDRVDVVAAGGAHGAQVGHRSLPPAEARGVLGRDRILGFSAHDEQELDQAADDGCNFALLSPVWRTTSKPDAAFLGIERAGLLTGAARLPVVWLGGVDAATIPELAEVPAGQRPAGVAVRSAIMQTEDPEAATRSLLEAWPD